MSAVVTAQKRWQRWAALVLLSVSAGCGESAPDPNAAAPWELPTAKAASSSAGSGAPRSAAPAPAAASADQPTSDVAPAMRDADFTESEHNRDPFRSFEAELRPKVQHVAQRAVMMPRTPIESMRLIAIITGLEQPRAMLVDEKGVGYVTTRGDFVGREEVVQGGGPEGLPVSLNWRIERIREQEVVLSREDPSAPGRPPLTRVIPLREVEEPSEGGDG